MSLPRECTDVSEVEEDHGAIATQPQPTRGAEAKGVGGGWRGGGGEGAAGGVGERGEAGGERGEGRGEQGWEGSSPACAAGGPGAVYV